MLISIDSVIEVSFCQNSCFKARPEGIRAFGIVVRARGLPFPDNMRLAFLSPRGQNRCLRKRVTLHLQHLCREAVHRLVLSRRSQGLNKRFRGISRLASERKQLPKRIGDVWKDQLHSNKYVPKPNQRLHGISGIIEKDLSAGTARCHAPCSADTLQ